MSYGEQKLVSLSRALASNPSLLLLDEIAAGTDEATRQGIVELVRRYVDQGGACIVVEHNVGVVTSVSDRVLFMQAGRVVSELRPDEVTTDPEIRRSYLGA